MSSHKRHSNTRIAPEIEQKVISDYLSKKGNAHEVGAQHGITDVSVYNILRRNGVTKLNGSRRFPNKNETYFDSIDTEEKAYLLGLIAADGSVDTKNRRGRLRIALKEEDRNVIDKYSDILLGEKGHVYVYQPKPTNRQRQRSVWLDVSSERLCDRLITFGIGPNKSFDCDPDIESLNETLFRAFLLGLSDGDGSLFILKRKRHIDTMDFALVCSQPLAVKVYNEVKRYLGISFGVTIKKCKKGSLIYLRLSSREECLRFLGWLYSCPVDCLVRKKQTYLEFKSHCQTYRDMLSMKSKHKYITVDNRYSLPRWRASVRCGKKTVYVGEYRTEQEAHEAQRDYLAAHPNHSLTSRTKQDIATVLGKALDKEE